MRDDGCELTKTPHSSVMRKKEQKFIKIKMCHQRDNDDRKDKKKAKIFINNEKQTQKKLLNKNRE